jgi:hypothetical protein
MNNELFYCNIISLFMLCSLLIITLNKIDFIIKISDCEFNYTYEFNIIIWILLISIYLYDFKYYLYLFIISLYFYLCSFIN